MRAAELQDFLERLSPGRGPEEGFRYGDPSAQVTGILVTWMATLGAIRRAAEDGCNLIVAHEDLFFPYSFQRQDLEPQLTWRVNRRRMELLARNGITVFRAHGTLDRLCVLDDFWRTLGLPEPVVKDGYIRIHEIPETSVGELAGRVKKRMGLERVRVTGDPARRVRRVGLPWGGLGLSLNVAFIESLLGHEPDALIAGETDDYAMRYMVDADVPMIETAHSVSENPGLRSFAERLRSEFPGVKVVFYECGVPWQYL